MSYELYELTLWIEKNVIVKQGPDRNFPSNLLSREEIFCNEHLFAISRFGRTYVISEITVLSG